MAAVESKIIRARVHEHSEWHAVNRRVHIAPVILVDLAGKSVIVVRQLCGHRRVLRAVARTGEQRDHADRL
jgi:hypothetical protein